MLVINHILNVQLETALATDRRIVSRKSQFDSETELSETQLVRVRPMKGSKLVNRVSKKRNRSGTASSAQSRSSTPAAQTDDGTTSPTKLRPPPASHATSPVTGSETITHVRSGSETSRKEPPLRRISSGASLSATRPASPSDVTTTTPALTPGVSATTDDEETDFQSAYSASPRESYVESGQDQVYNEDEDTPLASVGEKKKANVGRHKLPNLSNVKRERVSSTATATVRHHQPQPSPTFSEDTVVSPNDVISQTRIVVSDA